MGTSGHDSNNGVLMVCLLEKGMGFLGFAVRWGFGCLVAVSG